MFKEHIRAGMTAMDIGCGLGHFSLGLAKMVGEKGRIFSVDLQKGMLDRVELRAKKSGLNNIIQTLRSTTGKIGLDKTLDFVLAFWMVHEIPNPDNFLKQIYGLLKPEGILFIAEPKWHTGKKSFQKLIDSVQKIGFHIIDKPQVSLSYAMVLKK